jgi:hypothetical protein
MSTVSVHRASFWLLVVFCGVLSLATINLLFFAGQGRRYTAEDGDRDRAARISADLLERKERQEGDRLCMERIGAVEKVIASMATNGSTK